MLRGQRILFPRARGARDVLPLDLEAMGAGVEELTLYAAQVPRDPDAEGLRRIRAGEIDIATFASSSAVRNLVEMLGSADALRGVTLAAIGPVTADALRRAGLEPAVVAVEHTVDGLVRALVQRPA